MPTRQRFAKIVGLKTRSLTYALASSLYSADIPALLEKAQNGDAAAQFELARDYLHGEGEAKDEKKAFDWMSSAARQGNVDAEAGLGFFLASGIGTDKDESKGIEHLRAAAEKGSPKAAYNLARILMNKGPDYSREALGLMTKAAKGGMPEAGRALADWYYFGEAGIPIDYEKAFSFYLHAAEQGNPAAENAVGAMLYEGQGVPIDRKRAVEYYQKAAAKGDAKAEVALAHEYLIGEQLGRNKIEGLKWLLRANAQREITARNTLKDVIRGFSEIEISNALKETGLDRGSALDLTYERSDSK